MNHRMVYRIKRPSSILLALCPTPDQPCMPRNNFYRIRCPFDFQHYDNLFLLLPPAHQFYTVQCEVLNYNKFRPKRNTMTSIPVERMAFHTLYNCFPFPHVVHQLYNISKGLRRILLFGILKLRAIRINTFEFEGKLIQEQTSVNLILEV